MDDYKKMFMPGMEEEVEFLPLIPFEEDNDTKTVYSDVMPILPLKNTVLFPGVVIPITIGRDKSIAALKEAGKGDKIIGVTTQIDSNVEEPQFSDLHKIGTLAKIVKTLRMPDGSTTAILQGKARFEVKELLSSEPFFKASIE